jgi:acetyltransferase-like isoleucine patch superfamily enzyme
MDSEKLPRGVILPTSLPILDDRSWYEEPVVIQAQLSPMNLIQVGAFTGIYGGKIGHTKIGRYCSIAGGVDIASDQHPTEWLSTSMIQYVPNVHGWGDWLKNKEGEYNYPHKKFHSNDRVTIGNDVWIGQGAFIKSGIYVGDGAVIAAHSVVVKDVPPYAIVAGVPARVIKFRFEEEIVEELQRIKWWDYNIMAIENIDFSDIKDAIRKVKLHIETAIKLPFEKSSFNR